MDAIRQYVISVTSAAILCGVIKGIFQKGPAQGLIKMLCGTFLAFTFLDPVINLPLDSLSYPITIKLEEGRDAIADGIMISENASRQEITRQIAEVITEKANEFGLEVSVEVVFSDESTLIPIGLRIAGDVTPYAKIQIQHYIRNELGISEEDISWTE